MKPRIRTYTDLSKFSTLEHRYEYLRLSQKVGRETFGWDRIFNQQFYKSTEWQSIRNKVIFRDNGCDLGIPGFEIRDRILVHHMNPLNIKDLIHGSSEILDPEYLVCTSFRTHQAIHYGDKSLLPQVPIIRIPGDTKLW